jgi:hypothetical protein
VDAGRIINDLTDQGQIIVRYFILVGYTIFTKSAARSRRIQDRSYLRGACRNYVNAG